MFKYKLITLAVLILSSTTVSADTRELNIYQDFSTYKENKDLKLDTEKTITINVEDQAILDSFNVTLMKNEKNIKPEYIELLSKDRENIYNLNKGKNIEINGAKFVLLENKNGVLVLKNSSDKITYYKKSKIDIISFEKSLPNFSNMARIKLNNIEGDVNTTFSYNLSGISWKPKYYIYLKDPNTLELDYNIEINNTTDKDFKNVDVNFYLDQIKTNQQIVRLYNKMDTIRSNVSLKNQPQVEPLITGGKRILQMDASISFLSDAKTAFSYKNSKELSYIKENNINVYGNIKEADLLIPNSLIYIDKDELMMKQGEIYVYQGNKKQNNLIQISNTEEDKNGSIKVNLNKNNSVSLKVLSNEDIFSKDIIKNKVNNIKSKDLKFRKIKYKLSKILTIVNNKYNDENLTINNPYIVPEKNIEKIKELLKEMSSYNDKEDLTRKDFFDIEQKENEIKNLTIKKEKYNIKNKNNIDFYLLKVEY